MNKEQMDAYLSQGNVVQLRKKLSETMEERIEVTEKWMELRKTTQLWGTILTHIGALSQEYVEDEDRANAILLAINESVGNMRCVEVGE